MKALLRQTLENGTRMTRAARPQSSHVRSIPARLSTYQRTSFVDIVRDYGAVGNDFTDNTAAIQSALHSSVKWIYVPEGIFCANRIDMPSNVRLFGPGTLKCAGSKADFSSFIVFDGVDNASVEVSEIICSRSAYPTINTVVMAGASERCKVKGVHLSQSGRWALFNFNETVDCGIEDCLIENFEQSAVSHNLGGGSGGIVRPFVRRNTIIGNDTVTGHLITSEPTVLSNFPEITDNKAYGNGTQQFGFFIGSSNGTAIVKRNYISGTEDEMILSDGEITDNVCDGTGVSSDFGMSFTPGAGGTVYNTHIARNTIIGAGLSGINWGGETTTRGIIEDNYIRNCNQNGSTNYNGAGISVGEFGVLESLMVRGNTIVSTDGKMTYGIAEGTINVGVIANNKYENNVILGAAKADYRIVEPGALSPAIRKSFAKQRTRASATTPL